MDLLNRQYESFSDFDNHHLIKPLINEDGVWGFVVIHRKNGKTPSFGATRFYKYDCPEEGLRDALKLSKIMSYKSAMAGIPCGGAKGVLFNDGNIDNKKNVLKMYANEVNSFREGFVTGADVGVNIDDVRYMRTISPYMVGLNDNVVEDTALGIFFSIQTILKKIYGSESIKNRSFAIQGLGKVGEALLKLLSAGAEEIYVCDVDKEKIKEIKLKYKNIDIIDTNKIIEKSVDIFSPCALSNTINTESIKKINCRAVVGGANNQLESESIGMILHNGGILYAPDYIVNAGGLINVYDERVRGYHDHKSVENAIAKIKNVLDTVLNKSDLSGLPPFIISNKLAESVFNNYT